MREQLSFYTAMIGLQKELAGILADQPGWLQRQDDAGCVVQRLETRPQSPPEAFLQDFVEPSAVVQRGLSVATHVRRGPDCTDPNIISISHRVLETKLGPTPEPKKTIKIQDKCYTISDPGDPEIKGLLANVLLRTVSFDFPTDPTYIREKSTNETDQSWLITEPADVRSAAGNALAHTHGLVLRMRGN